MDCNPPSKSANKFRSFKRLRIVGDRLSIFIFLQNYMWLQKGVGFMQIAYLVENYLNQNISINLDFSSNYHQNV
jgi:hypothetical protein